MSETFSATLLKSLGLGCLNLNSLKYLLIVLCFTIFNCGGKEGKVAVDGWAKVTEDRGIDLAQKFQDYGVEGVIYTDIGRDGMMTGANIESTQELASALDIPVIASGGISSIDDIRRLRELEKHGVTAAITGRAIYESAFDFKEANQIAKCG